MSKTSIIERQFLAETPIKSFEWVSGKTKCVENKCDMTCALHQIDSHKAWSEDCQVAIVSCTAFHELTLKFPPAVAYQKAFFKWIMNKVESKGEFVCEDLCNIYVTLLSQKEETFSYKSYYLPLLDSYITLQESRSFISGGTTGLVTWKAGMLLAEWCLTNKDILANRKVVELGSGCGFTGLVLAKSLNLTSYTFTDTHHAVLERLRCNLELNCLDRELHRVEELSWEETVEVEKYAADVLLAADVVFDPSIIPALVATIANFLKATPSCVAYVASTERSEQTYNFFVQQLDNSGLNWLELETDNVPEVFFYDRSIKIHLLKVVLRP